MGGTSLSPVVDESSRFTDGSGHSFTPLSLLVKAMFLPLLSRSSEAASKAVQEQAWKDFVAKNSLDKLYEKYPDEASMRSFFTEWESLVSWLLYDNGAAKISPEKFGIKKLHY
jgi:hypothetical protein